MVRGGRYRFEHHFTFARSKKIFIVVDILEGAEPTICFRGFDEDTDFDALKKMFQKPFAEFNKRSKRVSDYYVKHGKLLFLPPTLQFINDAPK